MNVARIIVTTERGAKYLIDFAARTFVCHNKLSSCRLSMTVFSRVENVVIGGRMIVTWDLGDGKDHEEATIIYSPIKAIEAEPEIKETELPAHSSGRWCGMFRAVSNTIGSER